MREIERKVVNSTFGWMIGGIGLSTIIAYIMSLMTWSSGVFLGLFIASAIISLLLVFLFGKAVADWSYDACKWVFIGFSALEGVMLSTMFMVCSLPSIIIAYALTTGLFILMWIIGKTTKFDMLKFGSFFFCGLIMLIVASIINIFVASSWLYWAVTYGAIILFLGLIMYDAQRLKDNMRMLDDVYDDVAKKVALDAALSIYLDFINLLINIIRIVSNSK